MAGDYTVFAVNYAGTSYGQVDDAVVSNLVWELNGAGGCDITLATTDPDALLLQKGREVQVYRDGTILFWGPIVRIQANLGRTTWQCAGLLWYFDRRFMGRVDRVNQLANGDFEAGEASWTFSGGVTHALDTGIKVEGTQSEKLTGTPADHNTYATQTYTHTQYHPLGDWLTLAAWVYVPSVGYSGGARDDRGLFMIHRDATTGEVVGVAGGPDAPIDDDTTKNEWLPFEVGLPAVKQGDTVEVRLYPPHGIAYYDLVTLTLMESLAFDNADVADIIEGIVLYAQDLGPFTHGKNDLNIAVAAPNTGTLQSRAYQFAEHRNIGDSILEFVRGGICDVDITYTATVRTFRTYAPRKGSLYGTTLVLDTNLADFSWSWDGENAASAVLILGPGDGPDRPEGGASDPTFLGGLTLEVIESSPDDALVGELDDRAASALAVLVRPEIFEVTGYPAGLIGAVTVGDTVTVTFTYGHVVINDTYRVVRLGVDPKTDQATLTLNAEE